jgi:hypothetical protein
MNIPRYGAMLKLDWYQKKRPVLERMLAEAKQNRVLATRSTTMSADATTFEQGQDIQAAPSMRSRSGTNHKVEAGKDAKATSVRNRRRCGPTLGPSDRLYEVNVFKKVAWAGVTSTQATW